MLPYGTCRQNGLVYIILRQKKNNYAFMKNNKHIYFKTSNMKNLMGKALHYASTIYL